MLLHPREPRTWTAWWEYLLAALLLVAALAAGFWMPLSVPVLQLIEVFSPPDAIALAAARTAVPWWVAPAAIALFIIAALVVLRRAWVPMFGPVLFYDSIRTARKGRYVLLRCVYAAVLLFTLFILYGKYFGNVWDLWSPQKLHPARITQFAEEFFVFFITVQFVAVVVLTPALTAGAVAEEKERKTFEYLLTSDLRNDEIVLGKLAARLAYLVLFVLTGLPILSLLQFLGGVDPNMVLAGFAVTGATMISLAALSIFNSVYCRKPLTAIVLTYLEATAYVAATSFLSGFPPPLSFLAAGNTYTALTDAVPTAPLAAAMPPFGPGPGAGSGGWLPGLLAGLPAILPSYLLFHGLVAFCCLALAMGPLRTWNRRQASRGARRSFVLALTQKRLPRVWSEAILWKELFAEPVLRFNRSGMVATATFLTCSFFVGLFIMLCLFAYGIGINELGRYMNLGVRLLGTFVACLLLLGVAVRASGCLSGERDRQTLDGLLTTPVSNRQILWAKWIGSVVSGRKAWWFLGGIWLAGLLTTGLHPLALPLVTTAWLVYALFFASLGLWFSLTCRTTLRATIWTLVVVAVSGIGPWVLGLFWVFVVVLVGGRGRDLMSTEMAPVCLSPPATLNYLSFYEGDFSPYAYYNTYSSNSYGYNSYGSRRGDWEVEQGVKLVVALVGVLAYLIAAVTLYALARRRFAAVTGRLPLHGDEVGWVPPPEKRAKVVGGW